MVTMDAIIEKMLWARGARANGFRDQEKYRECRSGVGYSVRYFQVLGWDAFFPVSPIIVVPEEVFESEEGSKVFVIAFSEKLETAYGFSQEDSKNAERRQLNGKWYRLFHRKRGWKFYDFRQFIATQLQHPA